MHSEQRESLWTVVAAPLVWAMHFLLTYTTAAVWCAKFAGPERSLLGARLAIGAYTLLALAILGAVTARGLKRYRQLGEGQRHGDRPEDRARFLALATLLLCGLSALALLYSLMAVAFIGSCA